MSQYIVTNEYEADQVVDIIRRMTHDSGSKDLPKEVTVFVPSAQFKNWFYRAMDTTLREDPDTKNQRLLFKLGVVCPEDIMGDSPPFTEDGDDNGRI